MEAALLESARGDLSLYQACAGGTPGGEDGGVELVCQRRVAPLRGTPSRRIRSTCWSAACNRPIMPAGRPSASRPLAATAPTSAARSLLVKIRRASV